MAIPALSPGASTAAIRPADVSADPKRKISDTASTLQSALEAEPFVYEDPFSKLYADVAKWIDSIFDALERFVAYCLRAWGRK